MNHSVSASTASNAMAPQVGMHAPAFELPVTGPESETHRTVRLRDYQGRWLLLLFYPRDFSFVCPTELAAFSARMADFDERDCAVLAVSVDPISLHDEWMATPQDKGGLGPLAFPLASDVTGAAARAYGIYLEQRKIAGRGLFIIDPDGQLQFQSLNSLWVGRNPDDALQMLDALQAGGMCPSNWTRADGTIDPAMLLDPGRILGHYRIVEKLGQGGFGQVFRAYDLWLEREVAIKVLRPGRKVDRERMLSEARSAAALNHPNICTIYAVEEQEGLPVAAMEYLSGTTLSAIMRKRRLRADEIRVYAQQIAQAMAASHEHGVAHGDLKPANIMITDQGTLKVLDFGVAQRSRRPLGESRGPESARALVSGPARSRKRPPKKKRGSNGEDSDVKVGGTPQYMSPEQAAGKGATKEGDVFTFGLVLYEMVTGQRAVPQRDVGEALRTVRETDLTPLARRAPEPFRDILIRALRPKPEARPSMAAIAKRLDTL